MSRRVFLSHASEDRSSAEQICNLLESRGLSCWMAPRDVPPGSDYGEQIIEAIENAQVVVLVLSEAANRSTFVKSEIERTIAKAKPVIPVRVREVQPAKGLELFISRSQWIDAWTPPLDAAIDRLAAAIQLLAPDDELPPTPRAEIEEPPAQQLSPPSRVGRSGVWRRLRSILKGQNLKSFVLWGLQIWLAVFCVISGDGLLRGNPAFTAAFPGWSQFLQQFLGLPLLIGGVAQLIPRFCRWGAFLLLAILAASFFSVLLAHGDGTPHIGLGLLLVTILVGRKRLRL